MCRIVHDPDSIFAIGAISNVLQFLDNSGIAVGARRPE